MPPAAGAAVMATGIVSVGLHTVGPEALSVLLLALGSALWLVLAYDYTDRFVRDRARWEREADSPPALTAVAATTVLGTRYALLGWDWLAGVLLVIAVVVWPVLLYVVVRHWRPRMPGAVFLGTVATQGLAVLGATLSARLGVAWLGYAAMVMFWFGLVVYVAAFMRFELRQVLTGAGDHWVAGGALAISTLAAAKLVLADRAEGLWNTDESQVLRDMCGLLLASAAAWYVVLAVAELVEPRPRYDVRRWSTVFPMGMTAAATLAVATAVDTSWLTGPGRVLVWIGLAAWLAAAVGAGRVVRRASRGAHGTKTPTVRSTGPR
ncbi:tellurite resistance/C4-dicarboxylate transporter family protein [Streptomyces beihaiensis]|uniref:Tellurite resistance/C4-dicarboxylate transporter family protein n=1 Tax=Streptomyces beihaiensis TaxID=2984495 RepID=A0ABT3TMT2_9ACTN|nr:tellurite resistance/C4-dicarboxylate transporter family protein [Streptomyces beihaiensis]MCX3058358.1 tellurite resistance/C4-dicarboxylate transporter family protein [Streptomyces beihaiensis]